jgi:hypothetical protein
MQNACGMLNGEAERLTVASLSVGRTPAPPNRAAGLEKRKYGTGGEKCLGRLTAMFNHMAFVVDARILRSKTNLFRDMV